MAAEIDIEALKIFTKSRANEAENKNKNSQKKIKTASIDSRFTGSKKKCTSTWSRLKNFEIKSYC